MRSKAKTVYMVDFYANDVVDPSGYGEGQYWQGALQVTTGRFRLRQLYQGPAVAECEQGDHRHRIRHARQHLGVLARTAQRGGELGDL